MASTFLPLPPSLADAIQSVCILDEPREPYPYRRVFPSGECELIVNLANDELSCHDRTTLRPKRLRGAIAAGPQRGFIVIDTRQLRPALVVRLKPGGAWNLLGIPGRELADRHFELADLPALRTAEFRERVGSATGTAEFGAALESLFARSRRRNPHAAVEWAVRQICDYPGSVRIGELAGETGLSGRRFNELFLEQTGLTPKGFARVRRFAAALERVRGGRRHDWPALALESGYADQAHFIREFREFTGLTPAAYAAAGAPASPPHRPAPGCSGRGAGPESALSIN